MKIKEIAEELYRHQKTALELDRITTRTSGISLDDAYEIQRINIEKDLQSGDQFVGWKMGLTSKVKQLSVVWTSQFTTDC